MSEMCTASAELDRGAQSDFIGKRKRAMWRADKRIPFDHRVMSWRMDRQKMELMNNLCMDLYADRQKSQESWKKVYLGIWDITE